MTPLNLGERLRAILALFFSHEIKVVSGCLLFLFLFSAPLYVIQYLFDEAQILVDNVFEHAQVRNDNSASLITKQQWDYLHKLGQEVRDTLENVS